MDEDNVIMETIPCETSLDIQNKKWSDQETRKLIALYEENDILWNVTLKDYRNRVKKHEVLRNISEKLKIDCSEVQRKLHNLRSQYNSELKKVKKRTSGQGTDDVYLSNWPYFTALKFIQTKSPSTSSSMVQKMPDTHLEENVEASDETGIHRGDDTAEPHSPATFTAKVIRIPRQKPATTTKQNYPFVRPFTKPVSEQRIRKIETAVDELKAISNQIISHETPSAQINCEFNLFGQLVSTQLKKLPEVEALAAMQDIQSCLLRRRMACANRSINNLQQPLWDEADYTSNTGTTTSMSSTSLAEDSKI